MWLVNYFISTKIRKALFIRSDVVVDTRAFFIVLHGGSVYQSKYMYALIDAPVIHDI